MNNPPTPGSQPDLSIVIPAYNESQRIIPTIASIASYLDAGPLHWELIVADDGSTDNTVEIIERIGFPNVRVVRAPANQGKGAAVRRGLNATSGKSVLVTDADMSTPIQEITPMLAALTPRSMVIGSRAASGADVVGKSALRNLMSSSLHLIVRHGLAIDVADTQCGFKLMTADVAAELAELQTIDGFSFDLEWLFLCSRRDIQVREHPVEWYDAPGSKVDPLKDSVRFFRDIVKIRASHGTWSRRARRSARSQPDRSPVAETMAAGSPANTPSPVQPAVGVLTSLPPSTRTLNEYGFHLVTALSHQPELGRIVVLHDDLDQPVTAIDGVSAVPAWRPDSWINPIRILRTARRQHLDVVLFNIQFASFGDGRIPAALGLMTPALLRLFGIKTVVLLHNLVDTVDLRSAGFADSDWKIAVLTKIGRMLTRIILLANKVAVTLPGYVETLQTRYGATNVYLAPHGTFPHPDTGPNSSGYRTILTFGKFGTYKRVEDLIEAFRLLRDAGHDDIELVIAGSNAVNSPGYLEQIEATVGHDEPIRFTGYVDEVDVPRLFNDAYMVVFPYTSTTGSSGPLHQAGAAGKPVVLPAIGDFIEVIAGEGFTGELFTPADSTSLAAAIGRLLDDPELADTIGERNRRSANALDIDIIAGWHAMHLNAIA